MNFIKQSLFLSASLLAILQGACAMGIYEDLSDELVDIDNKSLSKMIDTIEKDLIEKDLGSVSNQSWAISLLYEPEYTTGNFGETGHSIVVFLGKGDSDEYRFFGADFMNNIKIYQDISYKPLKALLSQVHPRIDVVPGFIRTTKNNTNLKNDIVEHGDEWLSRSWLISKEKAREIIDEIEEERKNPPYYNAFNHNLFGSFYRKRTYNCAGWAADKIEKATHEKFGTLLTRVTDIRIPAFESFIYSTFYKKVGSNQKYLMPISNQ